MSRGSTLRGAAVILFALLVFNAVTVSLSSEESSLTVANLTEYYLHVFIEDTEFLYVAPERSVTYSSEARPTLLVTVFYSPGQGLRGSLTDTVEVPYRGSREACSCQQDEVWGDCIYTPPAGGTARLEILASDLEPEPEF